MDDDQDDHHQNVPRKRGRVHSPTPPAEVDDQDNIPASQSKESDLPAIVPDLSTQAETKRAQETDEEEDSESSDDDEDSEVVVTKAPVLQKRSSRPKAGDYDEIGKEIVLSAANRYRALLASQGAFPNPSRELKLIKKAWKLVNAESGVTQKALDLTPSIVTIVMISLCYAFLLINVVRSSRLKVEDHNFGAKPKQKRRLLWRLYMVLTVDGANGR
jgi:hypothetical protein